eukprot:TRINITY_DN13714_c0_g1_i1.p1 TRINITY_DN13714_c0_g1~~TRINITY_DN13714_c0_g1_i1.p1  ORF type:complete len:476 (+),score=64.53 TRINITY_DN13714_c0_g1_i1:125-1552(+)
MKFGRDLLDHINICEARLDPCSPDDYVNYTKLKRMISDGVSEKQFQKAHDFELARVTRALKLGKALKRDPNYAVINQQALDKISKKFDKRFDGDIRAANWVATSAELGKALGAFQIDGACLPPDFRRSIRVGDAHNHSACVSSASLVFAAGAISGVVSRTLTAPLDRIKVILQAGNAKGLDSHAMLQIPGSSTSNRLMGAARAIMKDGGIKAFWQGNGTNVIKVMPESAVRFFVYDQAKEFVSRGEVGLPICERLLAGAVAGSFSQALVYPLDVVKTRLAAAPAGSYGGIVDCIRSTLAIEGPLALYRGLAAALIAIAPASAVDLTVYNTLKSNHLKDAIRKDQAAKELPLLLSLSFGAISAVCGVLTTYPLTVVRTRLITQGMPGRPLEYDGVRDCLHKMWFRHGFRGLYFGLAPALLKTVPSVSIGYFAFEAAKRAGEAALCIGNGFETSQNLSPQRGTCIHQSGLLTSSSEC